MDENEIDGGDFIVVRGHGVIPLYPEMPVVALPLVHTQILHAIIIHAGQLMGGDDITLGHPPQGKEIVNIALAEAVHRLRVFGAVME